jgi:hypothetical protein
MFLSLDPSITCMGWCVLDWDGNPRSAGRLRPRPEAKSVEDRIESLLDQLGTLLTERWPEEIVMEVPSGHVNRRRHKGGGAGLATYGRLVGAVEQECRAYCQTMGRIPPRMVTETEWVRDLGGPKGKQARQALLERMLPGFYDRRQDPGGDICDAIRIGQWWAKERKIEGLVCGG